MQLFTNDSHLLPPPHLLYPLLRTVEDTESAKKRLYLNDSGELHVSLSCCKFVPVAK